MLDQLIEDSETKNGALSLSSSGSSLVDLFFLAGACRTVSPYEVKAVIERAYNLDQLNTLKVIFWAGDIRQGSGERRFFQAALSYLYDNHRQTFYNVIKHVPEFNRWDSLFIFHSDEKVLSFVKENLCRGNALLAKWMPRENKSHNKEFYKAFLTYTKWTPSQYRKKVVALSKSVETLMSANRWTDIKYKIVPSIAFKNYTAAFTKHDEDGFKKFLEKVMTGESKINAVAIFPYQIYSAMNRTEDAVELQALMQQWDALPNYLANSTDSIFPVCDVSSSMNGTPMQMSISLGLYISERTQGIFKDKIATFAEDPTIETLHGNLVERMNQLAAAHWGGSTNLVKTFEQILDLAKSNNTPESEMPKVLLVISDMEFNQSGSGTTNYQEIASKYESSGYKLPKIVFWNVNGRPKNVPVSAKQVDVALVSGASPSVLKNLLSGNYNPYSVVMDTIGSDRYKVLEK